MTLARVTLEATVGPDTDYQSHIIDPYPSYPSWAGEIAADLRSGGLVVSFSSGYETPEHVHAAIARMRDALDQLDIDVDAAMAAQAATVVTNSLTVDEGDHLAFPAASA